MADVKISALPAAVAIAGTDTYPAVQGGVTKKETLAQIAPAIGAYPPGTLVYRALLTSQDPANPIVTVLQNTLGVIVWTRTAAGTYRGVLANAFTANKTWMVIGQNTNDGPGFTIGSQYIDASTIFIFTYDIGSLGTADNELQQTAVEILVFP